MTTIYNFSLQEKKKTIRYFLPEQNLIVTRKKEVISRNNSIFLWENATYQE